MKQYYIKKDPDCAGTDIEWVVLNGRQFYEFVTSPAGKGRYFIDMGDFMIEADEAQHREWRIEQNHSYYLRKREKGIQTLSLDECLDRGDVDFIGESASVEDQIITDLETEALRAAISLLDAASYDLISKLYLADTRSTEEELAKIKNISQMGISKRKKKILEILKKAVLKPIFNKQ